MTEKNKQSFSQLAESASEPTLIRELLDYLRTNKKWWLAPIVVAMLLLGALLFLSTTAAAPFIYTLF